MGVVAVEAASVVWVVAEALVVRLLAGAEEAEHLAQPELLGAEAVFPAGAFF